MVTSRILTPSMTREDSSWTLTRVWGRPVTCASATHRRLPRVSTNAHAMTSSATMHPTPTLALAPMKAHNIPEAYSTLCATWGTISCGGISWVGKVGLGLKSARSHREAPPRDPRGPSRCTNIRSTVTSDIVSGGAHLSPPSRRGPSLWVFSLWGHIE